MNNLNKNISKVGVFELTRSKPPKSKIVILAILMGAYLVTACVPVISTSAPTMETLAATTVEPTVAIPQPSVTPTVEVTAIPSATPIETATATDQWTPTAEKSNSHIVAYIGYTENPAIHKIAPLQDKDAPENVRYPLIRDKDGEPLLGVLATDQAINLYGKDVPGAFVVGRIAAVRREGNLAIDLDVPKPGTKGEYVRFIVAFGLAEECPIESVSHAATWPLSEMHALLGEPNNNSPVITEMEKFPIKFAPDYCNELTQFTEDAVGAQFGFILPSYARTYSLTEHVDITDLYTNFITGGSVLSTYRPWFLADGILLPDGVVSFKK